MNFKSKLTVFYCIFGISIIIFCNQNCFSWGFWAHKQINKIAVFTLPTEMMGFFKANIDYISNHAVDADKRRYAVEGEAPKHYIDIDHYCNFPHSCVPKNYKEAIDSFSKDTLLAYGTSPWNLEMLYYQMVKAFESENAEQIIKKCTDFGHYLGDIHVPLHTTINYNGQLSHQKGIHAFWESRVPELLGDDYDYFIGKAVYIENKQEKIWEIVLSSSAAVDSVLRYEKLLSSYFDADKKYTFEDRAQTNVRTYSQDFTKTYSAKLDNMVYKRLSLSIINLGSFWFSAWIDAGQPNLNKLSTYTYSEEDLKAIRKLDEAYKNKSIKSRGHWE